MKTNYAAHDARYQTLRAGGAVGWDTDEGYRAREALFDWAFARTTGTRLLELGCGAGNVAPALVRRGFSVTGVDISATAIAWATEHAYEGAQFVVGNAVEGIAGTYDVILDGSFLHCIIGDDRRRLLANVRAALAPGGAFVVATMSGTVTLPALRAVFDEATRCQVVDGIAYRYIGDPDAILDELRAAGFTIAASRIQLREDDDDQDHLWAIAHS